MFKRIIVGVDGTQASINASKIALKLGTFFNIPVIGVYVVDSRLIDESFIADLAGILGFTYYEGISAKVKEFLEKQGDVVLTEFSSLGRTYGAKVSVVQLTGLPYKEITNLADPEDLIVVGRFGKRPIKGITIGSNSEKIARYSKCPVMIFPEEKEEISKVAVAYDGSENSKMALRICGALKELFNYTIDVIFVETEENPLRDGLREEIGEALNKEFDLKILRGFPEEQIVKYVKDNSIDMLFLGAFGKGRFRELFLGSVTSYVLHHLTVPMVLCKAVNSSASKVL